MKENPMRETIAGVLRQVPSFAKLSLISALFSGALVAQASDISWTGRYRAEGVLIENPGLNGQGLNKAYLLHHLVLQPKMIAADGLTIFGRFDVFNNANFGAASQAGQVFGNGPRGNGDRTQTGTNGNSNVLSQAGARETIEVTQLYAQWTQEFGSLIVGRAPLHFGLGIQHNAGNGEFDHWFDTRDMVGYKIVTGNLFILPILAKTSEGLLSDEDDVNDYIVQVQYENPETDLALGVMFEWRTATNAGTDTPFGADPAIGGAGATLSNAYKHRLINIYSTQRLGNFKVSVEGGFLTGKSGVRTAGGEEVELDAYGIAGEVLYKRPESRWDAGVLLGVASGDDPNTTNSYEGYVFDRNYDVAFLMFNHRLGQADFLRTGLTRLSGGAANLSVAESIDTEAISNVFYVSPRYNQSIRDNLAWGAAFTYGAVSQSASAGAGNNSNFGFELDLSLTYKPVERLTWLTQAGVLFPGDAWKGANSQFENKMAYGFTTKAAISF